MRYVRTYHLQSSHLNSSKAYHIAWALSGRKHEALPPDLAGMSAGDAIWFALCDVHGHNFKIEVCLEGTLDQNGWLVDDVALAKIVMEWDNINISLHPDFIDTKARATTELMSKKLFDKLDRAAPLGVVVEYVRVYENADIYAEAS